MKVFLKSVIPEAAARFVLLYCALFLFFQAQAQEIRLSGRVVDEQSDPIPNVKISLESARITTFTSGTGNFSLISYATGMPDLIRVGQGKCSFDGRRLFIGSHGEMVEIGIFDLSGRLHTQILKPVRLSGEYLIYPSAYITSELTSIYILRVIVDTRRFSYKLVKHKDINYDRGVEYLGGNMQSDYYQKSEESTDAIDTLIFTHPSYKTKLIPISAYASELGTVQLEDSAVEITAPGSLSAKAVSASQIDLSWSDNSDNESGFRIERSRDGSTGWKLVSLPGANIRTYRDKDLYPSTGYYYRVQAFNAGGRSLFSNTAHDSTAKLNFKFKGGELADLRAVSPELIFGDLSIDGILNLRSSDSSVVFQVDNMRINAKVRFSYPFCLPNPHPPELTIHARGGVWVNAPILFNGWWGSVVPPDAVCVSCQGTDGGDLTIHGSNIYVNDHIYTYGGDGGYTKSVDGVLYGCHAGNGGDIFLHAADSLYISARGSHLRLEGGEAGDSTNSIRGDDGRDGILDLKGQQIGIEEINLGSAEENMYDYKAQLLPYERMTVYGHCAYREEHDHRNDDGTWYRYLGFANVDWIEDIYLLYHTGGPIDMELAASDPQANLDIFLTTTGGKILESGKGPTSSESISYETAVPGYYWIWVSYYDYGPEGSTDYTLKFMQ